MTGAARATRTGRARATALVTWAYAGMFGVPAVPVAVFLVREGRLPSLWGLFDLYGGPWSSSVADDRMVALLVGFAGVVAAAGLSGLLLWRGRRSGAVLNLALLPVEAVFWVGFALPVPWLLGVARVVLVARAWRGLGGARRSATDEGPEPGTPLDDERPAPPERRGRLVDVEGLEGKMAGRGQKGPFTSTRAHKGPELH
ncbi:hypothetical protein [Oryzobacter terrae]|uniref:hypothetical protein n=1 Tax=Oryzobacter terrae TaxID=1620385 RepID=UPI00366B251C